MQRKQKKKLIDVVCDIKIRSDPYFNPDSINNKLKHEHRIWLYSVNFDEMKFSAFAGLFKPLYLIYSIYLVQIAAEIFIKNHRFSDFFFRQNHTNEQSRRFIRKTKRKNSKEKKRVFFIQTFVVKYQWIFFKKREKHHNFKTPLWKMFKQWQKYWK